MAEIIYADPVTEDILINESDEIAGGEETECTCCCDCETDGPAASFTSEQTSADPEGNACCVQFADTSTPGDCGEIVSWLWDFGDENTSTSQNPEHCYTGAGPWTVRLTVTDSSGCTDFLETSVPCPCNCATNAPEADFSYTQTDDDPCCFQFNDESVAEAECGAIASWLWDFGDGDTSTSENPTHCYDDAGPWDVTLTVTDDMGCTDSVVMEVTCEPNPCSCCDEEFLPETATVTISGFAENVAANDCDACSSINGTHTVTSGLTGVFCHYQKVFDISPCRDGFSTQVTITLVFCQFVDKWRLTIVIDGGQTDYWEKDALASCRGSHTFDLVFSGGIDRVCDVPATVTVAV